MSELRTSTLVRFVVRHGSWVCLLPIPLWLLFRIALEPQAAWYARYVSANPKEAPVERFEKALSHYWTGSKEVIEIAPVSPQHVEATFDTCLSADEPVEVPVMLVAAGSARLLVNQHVVLELASSSEHATIGKRWTIWRGDRCEWTGRWRFDADRRRIPRKRCGGGKRGVARSGK